MEKNNENNEQENDKKRVDEAMKAAFDYAKKTWQNPEFVRKYEKMYSKTHKETNGLEEENKKEYSEEDIENLKKIAEEDTRNDDKKGKEISDDNLSR